MPIFPTGYTVSEEVASALKSGDKAVVALESTLITHGLPYPTNVETALGMEQSIRSAGAVPATMGIIRGQIVVGLSLKQIEHLAASKNVRKCSRRDLAIAFAQGEDGATTVAGTMIIAHRVGIHVFATGGIGGVHRGQPFDVSADLMELGRTPVAVVCSGAKSILDLPLTLEVLETQGVPVIGMNTTTLPAFYSRSSGLPLTTSVKTPHDAAKIVHAVLRLGMDHGVLITVPVPSKDELSADIAEAAIKEATAEAHTHGLTGAAVTPFVLGRVAELTEGASRQANTSLLLNNARVAALIALALRHIEMNVQ